MCYSKRAVKFLEQSPGKTAADSYSFESAHAQAARLGTLALLCARAENRLGKLETAHERSVLKIEQMVRCVALAHSYAEQQAREKDLRLASMQEEIASLHATIERQAAKMQGVDAQLAALAPIVDLSNESVLRALDDSLARHGDESSERVNDVRRALSQLQTSLLTASGAAAVEAGKNSGAGCSGHASERLGGGTAAGNDDALQSFDIRLHQLEVQMMRLGSALRGREVGQGDRMAAQGCEDCCSGACEGSAKHGPPRALLGWFEARLAAVEERWAARVRGLERQMCGSKCSPNSASAAYACSGETIDAGSGAAFHRREISPEQAELKQSADVLRSLLRGTASSGGATAHGAGAHAQRDHRAEVDVGRRSLVDRWERSPEAARCSSGELENAAESGRLHSAHKCAPVETRAFPSASGHAAPAEAHVSGAGASPASPLPARRVQEASSARALPSPQRSVRLRRSPRADSSPSPPPRLSPAACSRRQHKPDAPAHSASIASWASMASPPMAISSMRTAAVEPNISAAAAADQSNSRPSPLSGSHAYRHTQSHPQPQVGAGRCEQARSQLSCDVEELQRHDAQRHPHETSPHGHENKGRGAGRSEACHCVGTQGGRGERAGGGSGREAHLDGGRVAHLDGGRVAHLDGGREAHLDGGRVAHLDGGREAHLDGGRVVHLDDDGVDASRIHRSTPPHALPDAVDVPRCAGAGGKAGGNTHGDGTCDVESSTWCGSATAAACESCGMRSAARCLPSSLAAPGCSAREMAQSTLNVPELRQRPGAEVASRQADSAQCPVGTSGREESGAAVRDGYDGDRERLAQDRGRNGRLGHDCRSGTTASVNANGGGGDSDESRGSVGPSRGGPRGLGGAPSPEPGLPTPDVLQRLLSRLADSQARLSDSEAAQKALWGQLQQARTEREIEARNGLSSGATPSETGEA